MLWIDGQISEGANASFNLTDRGLLLGDGLFETLPCFNGIPFLADAHLKRMTLAGDQIGLDIDPARFNQAITDLATADPSTPGTIRVTVTRGPGQRGLMIPSNAKPVIFATRSPWDPSLAFGTGTLAISKTRRNMTSPLSAIKSLNYLDNILAHQEARMQGADDALFLNNEGGIACTTMANLFMMKKNRFMTAAPSEGILKGVMRGLVMSMTRETGSRPIETRLAPIELFHGDCVFTTNSIRLLTQITEIDDTPLPLGKPRQLDRLILAISARIRKECAGYDVTPDRLKQ